MSLLEDLAQICLHQHYKVVTAESCTGGLVAAAITSLAGSSQWFERGYVTYSNEAKHQDLGVPLELIEQYGAVSREVAHAMARGAKEKTPAQLSVAITGIAGPEGGSADKPVGTVWFAWGLADGSIQTERALFTGDRQSVRTQAVNFALANMINLCQKT
jgi:nicotinamide-nucleotide amidase